MDGVAGLLHFYQNFKFYDLNVEDELKINRFNIRIFGYVMSTKLLRFIICMTVALTGLLFSTQAGFYYLSFVDHYACSINLIVAITMESLFFMWYRSWSQEMEPLII